jgi:ceramide synthetase
MSLVKQAISNQFPDAKSKAEYAKILSKTGLEPVNPITDQVLGVIFVSLMLRLAYALYLDHDLAITFACCLLVVLAAIVTCKIMAFVFGMMFSRWRQASYIPVASRHPLKSKLTMSKFQDQAWQLVIHSSMSAYEVYLLQGTTWWENPQSCFDPCPSTYPEQQDYSWALKTFYMLQLAIWLWTGFSCKWLEPRRKDYIEMMLHHCFTVGLVLNSLLNNEQPIGLVILFIHDFSDVFCDLLKMTNYMKLEESHGLYITEFFFVLNTFGTWIYFRLYKFPFSVVKGAVLDYYVNGSNCPNRKDQTLTVSMLVGLCFLHCYWFALFIRLFIKLTTEGKKKASHGYEGLSGTEYFTDEVNPKET